MSFDPFFIIALVLGVTIHEFCHAAAANHLGDPTAKHMGRLTLNPLAHLDLMGTLMLFLIGLGWGKPVPVNPHNLYHPKRDSALVSLAGPASNILLAIAVSLPYKYLLMQGLYPQAAEFFLAIFQLNVLLALFNFIPLPPLDGSKMVGVFVPDRYYGRYQHFLDHGVKYFIGFILIDSFVLSNIFGFSFMWLVIGNLYTLISSVILMGT